MIVQEEALFHDQHRRRAVTELSLGRLPANSRRARRVSQLGPRHELEIHADNADVFQRTISLVECRRVLGGIVQRRTRRR